MSQRRLSQDSIDLSGIPTKASTLPNRCHVSLVSNYQEALLAIPTEIRPTHDGYIDGSDEPGLHDSPLQARSIGSPNLWHRIGRPSLFILPLGSLLLVGSIAFLFFLWRGASRARNRQDPGHLWQTIVFERWIMRAVTITAALMRSVMTAQAAIVAAMIAAVIVESAGVHLSELPFLSIARSVTLSPVSLALPILKNTCVAPGMVFPSFIVMTSLLMLRSQLISTILFFDMGDIYIPGPANHTMHKVLAHQSVLESGQEDVGFDFLSSVPDAF
ncbi:hypothetical protein PG985_011608 [Apiospora marii]|uniref:uncharacterized protein n=1 Tax=Apiospora marii TaxID=335849 RepID=UPI00312FEFBC